MQIPPVDRSPTQWRSQGADLYSTGASGPVPVRPVHAANPVESTDRLGEGTTLREPTEPSVTDEANRDWTVSEAKKDAPKEPEEPPKEPISKQLLEFLQTLWRARAEAVDLAQEINKATLPERLAQQAQQAQDKQSLTYSDPKIKRTGGL